MGSALSLLPISDQRRFLSFHCVQLPCNLHLFVEWEGLQRILVFGTFLSRNTEPWWRLDSKQTQRKMKGVGLVPVEWSKELGKKKRTKSPLPFFSPFKPSLRLPSCGGVWGTGPLSWMCHCHTLQERLNDCLCSCSPPQPRPSRIQNKAVRVSVSAAGNNKHPDDCVTAPVQWVTPPFQSHCGETRTYVFTTGKIWDLLSMQYQTKTNSILTNQAWHYAVKH